MANNQPGSMNNTNPNTGGNPFTLFNSTNTNGFPGEYGYSSNVNGTTYGGSYSAAPAAPTTPGAGSFGPDITLGPDGNVYGYSRQYDNATNSYTYAYKNLGAATDLATVSTASGIPVGMLQASIAQQQVTLSNLAAQGVINPYIGGGQMTQQQVTQALDSVRTAQQYQSALSMQGVATNGMTYAQMQDAYNQTAAKFNYDTQGNAQSAQSYGWQHANDQGANYNTASTVPGQTWGQLGIKNDNSQAAQQYAYGQNYDAANPYSGLSNGQTGLQASNVQNAYNLTQGQYNIGHQAEDNQLKDLNRTYDTVATTYNLGHQANQQALSTYQEATRGLQAEKNQSRDLTGLGWAGIQKPIVAGWT